MPSSQAGLQLSTKLVEGEELSDTDIVSYLDQLDVLQERAGPLVGTAAPSDGAMMLARREQLIRVSSDRCLPAQFVLQPGGRVTIAVAPGSPQQAFSIGRDVEEAFVTPVIPAGSSYEWTPPGPGRYFVQSEVYPHLRSALQVLQEEQQEEATAVPLPGNRRRNSSILGSASARTSLAGEAASAGFGSGMARTGATNCKPAGAAPVAAVDEPISFPALAAARLGPQGAASTLSRATQTGSGGSGGSTTVSRHTSTGPGSSEGGPAVVPGPVFRRFALAASDAAINDEREDAAGSLLEPPSDSGLRRRGRSSSSMPAGRAEAAGGGLPAAAGAQQQQQQRPPLSGGRSVGTLPPLGRPLPVALPAADNFSSLSLSGGSAGSPRSGSGSERSSNSSAPPLYVQRCVPRGMLQTTHAYASAAARSSYSDSRSGGSDEMQPLLYSLGSRGGQGHLQTASYSSSSGYCAYPTPTPHHAHQEDRTPRLIKCPRCSKEYLSTINQRRCISSHLHGGSGRGARGGSKSGSSLPDSSQLAAFWDGLEEPEKRAVMDLRTEHNGEHLMRQLEIQKLHRQRSGAMDQLTQEQKRLHTSGMLLHSACAGGRSGSSATAAIQTLTGAHLMRVLNEVSEGTFLFDRNPISQDEFRSGNNLEAGLGALVMKRLVDAHLAAKQRQADRLQRELEDQEAAQQAQKAGKQQQHAGGGGSSGAQQQAGGIGGTKKKPKAKAKGKASVPPPTSKAAPVVAAAAAAAATAAPAGAAASPRPASSPASDTENSAAEPAASKAAAPAKAAAVQGSQPAEQVDCTAAAAAAAANGTAHAAAPLTSNRNSSSPQKRPPAAGTSSISTATNSDAGEEDAGAGSAADMHAGAESANGWRTAGSGRTFRASSHAHAQGVKSAPYTTRVLPPPAGQSRPASRGASRSSSSSVPPERPTSRAAAERPAVAPPRSSSPATAVPPIAAPPKPSTAAAAPTNGKLAGSAAGSRQPPVTAAAAAAAASGSSIKPPPPQQQQQAPPSRDSFPALPAAIGGSRPVAAAAPASAPASASGVAAAAAGFSYAAAAAKSRKEASTEAPNASKPQAAAVGATKVEAAVPPPQQPAPPIGSLAQQPKSWPVPGSNAGVATAATASPVKKLASSGAAAAAAADSAEAEQQVQAAAVPAAAVSAAEAAPPAATATAAAPDMPAPAPAPAGTAEVPAAAAGQVAEPAAATAADAAVEAQRCTSVTPPISDAGSPPPGILLPMPPMPGGFPMPGWPVGPDGAPLLPPPVGYFWGMMPPPPPVIQFGNMEPAPEGMAPGPYPFPFYPPHAHYPAMPPHPAVAAGMPMPLPHMLPYGGDGQLAPFPPGMPVPLPPDAAEELAAVAAAAEGGRASGTWAAQEGAEAPEGPVAGEQPPSEEGPAGQPQEAAAAGAAGPVEEEEEQAAAPPERAGQQQQQQPPMQQQQQQEQSSEPSRRSSSSSRPGSRKPGSFLAMLQEACGVPAGAPPLPAAAASRQQQRSGRRSFDAAAAAAELERRWQAALPQSVPASSLPPMPPPPPAVPAEPSSGAAPMGAAPRQDRRSSSGGTVASKPAGKAAAGKAGSGRASPAPGKPVVVAVRAWSSSDEAPGAEGQGGPKWRIAATAKQLPHPQPQPQPFH